MRDTPDLRDEVIAACLSQHYGIEPASIEPLALGYDFDAAVRSERDLVDEI